MLTTEATKTRSAVSSRRGRQWLNSARECARGSVLILGATVRSKHEEAASLGNETAKEPSVDPVLMQPPVAVVEQIGQHQVRVSHVEIPDVSAVSATPVEGIPQGGDLQRVATTLQEASEDLLSELAEGRLPAAAGKRLSEFLLAQTETGEREPGGVNSLQVDAEVSEPMESWTLPKPGTDPGRSSDVGTTDKDKDDPGNQADSDSLPKPDSELKGILESIHERFSSAGSALLMFSGCEPGGQLSELCARVALELAGQDLGPVLLVDADDRRIMSQQDGSQELVGVSDALSTGEDWFPLLRTHAATGLDFLPRGQHRLRGQEWMTSGVKLAHQLRARYRFVCICTGEASSASARLWSELSDGCFVMVRLQHSGRLESRLAITELKSHGARILGCVATGSPVTS